MIERIVTDIDSVVEQVRFDGWKWSKTGVRAVKRALRTTLMKYKLHKDAELSIRHMLTSDNIIDSEYSDCLAILCDYGSGMDFDEVRLQGVLSLCLYFFEPSFLLHSLCESSKFLKKLTEFA